MNVFRWFADRFSQRGKALSLYRRGMSKSNRHEHQAAIDDYTLALGLPHVPPDVQAMALYNRALVYAAAGDRPKATADLEAVLAMPAAPPNIKAEAKRKLMRMER